MVFLHFGLLCKLVAHYGQTEGSAHIFAQGMSQKMGQCSHHQGSINENSVNK